MADYHEQVQQTMRDLADAFTEHTHHVVDVPPPPAPPPLPPPPEVGGAQPGEALGVPVAPRRRARAQPTRISVAHLAARVRGAMTRRRRLF